MTRFAIAITVAFALIAVLGQTSHAEGTSKAILKGAVDELTAAHADLKGSADDQQRIRAAARQLELAQSLVDDADDGDADRMQTAARQLRVVAATLRRIRTRLCKANCRRGAIRHIDAARKSLWVVIKRLDRDSPDGATEPNRC